MANQPDQRGDEEFPNHSSHESHSSHFSSPFPPFRPFFPNKGTFWDLVFESPLQLETWSFALKSLTQEMQTLLINTSLQRDGRTDRLTINCFNSFSHKSHKSLHLRPVLASFPHVTHVTHVTYLTYLTILALSLLLPTSASAAFGVTSISGSYTVDTGGGLDFKVSQSSGDITSIQYNAVEYQATDKNSHIASGLGTATVAATTYGNSYIRISITTGPTNSVVSSLTHYLMVTNGLNAIFMATYTTAEPAVGELRWITRLQSAKLSNGPVPSDNRGTTNAIESSDVFGRADGTTRSKYYGHSATHVKDRG